MEKPVVIKEITEQVFSKNGKPFTKVNVQALDTGETMKVSVWGKHEEFNFKPSDEVTMGLTGSDFKGKTYYSTFINQVLPLGEKKPIKVKQEVGKERPLPLGVQKYADVINQPAVPQEVWDGKDRRMVRMNSWGHAVEIIKASMESTPEKVYINPSSVYSECLKLAKDIEREIYAE